MQNIHKQLSDGLGFSLGRSGWAGIWGERGAGSYWSHSSFSTL